MSTPASSPRAGRARVAEALAIGIGGALGSTLRAAIGLLWSPAARSAMPPPFVDPTLVANALGAGLLGLLLARRTPLHPSPLLRPFLTVGVLGSLTTWSTLAAATQLMAGETGPGPALARLAGSLVVGLIAFAAGDRIGRHLEAGAR